MRQFIIAPLLLALATSFASGDLIISAVVDGTQSGGNPKVIQFEAVAPIADLSTFFVLRDTNGTAGGPFTPSTPFNSFPAISLAVGDVFYLTGTSASDTFAAMNGGFNGPSLNDGIANHNGDDILAVSTSANVADIVDAFGLLGQGDTDFAANSTAIRVGSTPNATGVMDAGNFTITSFDEQVFIDTFLVPEPTGLGLLLVSLLGLVWVRRK